MGLLSQSSTYAIRAALRVAAADLAPGRFLATRLVAKDLDAPFPFLTKVLQGLVQRRILVSQRGPTGGVALARPASQITLLDVVRGAGDDDVFTSCVLGLPQCDETAPCALHDQWQGKRAEIEALFVKTTLADLLGSLRERRT